MDQVQQRGRMQRLGTVSCLLEVARGCLYGGESVSTYFRG